jgi:hypothetical protein
LAVFLSLNVAPAVMAAPWNGRDGGFSRVLKMVKQMFGLENNSDHVTIPKG